MLLDKVFETFSVNTYSIIISTKLYQVCTSERSVRQKVRDWVSVGLGQIPTILQFIFYFFKLLLFTFNLLVVLGLHPCGQYSASCSSWGLCALQCTGCSLQWILSLASAGSRGTGFRSCSTWAQQFWLEGSRAQAPKLWS